MQPHGNYVRTLLNYFDVRHSPSAGIVQYNYITQKFVNEGVSEELHAEKNYKFLVSVKFLSDK